MQAAIQRAIAATTFVLEHPNAPRPPCYSEATVRLLSEPKKRPRPAPSPPRLASAPGEPSGSKDEERPAKKAKLPSVSEARSVPEVEERRPKEDLPLSRLPVPVVPLHRPTRGPKSVTPSASVSHPTQRVVVVEPAAVTDRALSPLIARIGPLPESKVPAPLSVPEVVEPVVVVEPAVVSGSAAKEPTPAPPPLTQPSARIRPHPKAKVPAPSPTSQTVPLVLDEEPIFVSDGEANDQKPAPPPATSSTPRTRPPPKARVPAPPSSSKGTKPRGTQKRNNERLQSEWVARLAALPASFRGDGPPPPLNAPQVRALRIEQKVQVGCILLPGYLYSDLCASGSPRLRAVFA